MVSNEASPSLCLKGCGFYGSEENRNMCSKCYSDFLKEVLIANSLRSLSIQEHGQSEPRLSKSISTDRSEDCLSSIGVVDTRSDKDHDGSSRKKKVNRCKNCNKKVGLTGFKCRCRELFCGAHRYPEEHCCPFDFKKLERDLLIKQNPLITGDRMKDRI